MFINTRAYASIICCIFFGYLLPLSAQTPFWTETFSSRTASLNNWTSGGFNGGSLDWEWSDNPAIGGYNPFISRTSIDGFMRFDSESNGPFDHEITLTSPVIDCSGRNQVFLEMFSQYIFYIYEYSEVQLGVNINGGDFVYRTILEDVEPGYFQETSQRTVLELPEAANQANVRIQIKWRGFLEFFLHLDDLALYGSSPAFANDLSIRDIRQPSAFETPLSQVDSLFFAGFARNEGTTPQTNVFMRVTVIDPDQNIVFQDSSESINLLDTGAPDAFLSISSGFLPGTIGEYLVIQTVESDEEDAFFSNNRQVFSFVVSEDLYAVHDDDLQDVAAPLIVGDFWEGGNRYYIKNGVEYLADKARFMVFSDDGSGNEAHIGETISILLYKSKVDLDTAISLTDEEVELAGFTNYTLTPQDRNFTFIEAPLFQDDGETQGIPLEDNTDYILMISLPANVGIPYTYRKVIYDISSIVRNGEDWSLDGFESIGGERGRLALVVDMVLRNAEPDAVLEPRLSDDKVRSFPNPATQYFFIDLQLENTSPVQLQLMNTAGQKIWQKEYHGIRQERLELDLSSLASGFYLLKIRTDEGVKTLKISKQ